MATKEEMAKQLKELQEQINKLKSKENELDKNSLVFAEDITGSKVQELLPAIIICIVATYLASLGNMISKILQREKVSPIEANS